MATRKNTEIISAPGFSPAERLMIEHDLDNRCIAAIVALRTGKVPENMISSHPGKGGQVFKYIKHTHATQVLVDAFPALMFDWKVLDWEIFEDKTAAARCQLDVHFLTKQGERITLTVIEVGAFEDNTKGKVIPFAMRVAAAASRALPRTMMRMFGWGIELYPDSETTPAGWWASIMNYANTRSPKVPEEVIKKWTEDQGIAQDPLQDHYTEIVQFVMNWKPPAIQK